MLAASLRVIQLLNVHYLWHERIDLAKSPGGFVLCVVAVSMVR